MKLHGSFPEHRPVITREDYRTHYKRQGVLIGTVQQALVESVFLLLGFSGDDPNFQAWHGWVRDQLGEDAPRLYVAGFLKLRPPQRASLEARGILPIDVADYAKASLWGRDAHRIALQWILDVLSQETDPTTRWPEPQGQPSSAAIRLSDSMPVSSLVTDHMEPSWPTQDASPEDEDAAVHNLIRAWRQYRESYDGWVVFPFRRIGSLSALTGQWEEILLRRTKTWAPADRLIALRELSWRHEILMNPHKPEFAEAITEAVRDFDSTHAQPSSAIPEESDSLLSCRNALLLPLLTQARYQFDGDQFRDVVAKIRNTVVQGSDAWHHLQHEECLWALIVQDFDELQIRLDAWSVASGEPMWAIRKAALLADMGSYGTGIDLAESTLIELEKKSTQTKSIRIMSRLAWALQWRMARETQKLWDVEKREAANHQVILDRWSQLARYECDVRSEWQRFEQAVQTVRTATPKGSLLPPPHRRDVLRGDEYGRYRHAYRAVRMVELAGIPTRIPGVKMAAETLRKAADAMAGLGVDHALSVAVRVGSECSPEVFREVLSPGNMAILEESVAARMVESLERGRDYRLRRREGSLRETTESAGEAAANIDALARCMARAGNEEAKSHFPLGFGVRCQRRAPSRLYG